MKSYFFYNIWKFGLISYFGFRDTIVLQFCYVSVSIFYFIGQHYVKKEIVKFTSTHVISANITQRRGGWGISDRYSLKLLG